MRHTGFKATSAVLALLFCEFSAATLNSIFGMCEGAPRNWINMN